MRSGNDPLVSVIIPTWNRADDLVIAINSVLSQNYLNVEILVCDDGSTDGSGDFVRKLNDERVRWVAGNHSGCPAFPRNNGIREARGQWVAFLDSDDVWMQNKLKQQLNNLSIDQQYYACTSNALVINSNSDSKYQFFGDSDVSESSLGLFQLLQDNKVITSSVILHKNLLDLIGYFPETKRLRAYEDYAFWLRLATVCQIKYHPECLILYRDHPATSVRNLTSNHVQKKIYVLHDYLLWILNTRPKLFPKYILLVMCALIFRLVKKVYFKVITWAFILKRQISNDAC